MRLPEQRLWDLLRPSLALTGAMTRRVENVVDEGFPDVFVKPVYAPCALLELKAREDGPMRIASLALGKNYGLSVEQRNWWLEYHRANGRGWIISSVNKIIYAHTPACADKINAMSFEEFCDTACAMGLRETVQVIARGSCE